MKRVATAAVLIPLVLLAVFRLPTIYLSWLIGLVAILAAKEYLDIAERFGVRAIRVPVYLFIAGLFLLGYANEIRSHVRSLFLLVSAISLLLLVVAAMRRTDLKEATLAMAFSGFALPYIGLTLFCLVPLHGAYDGWFFIVFVFLAVWVGDTAAYYVGRSIGRHRLAPSISPKKTWEGAIASAIFSAIVVALWTQYGLFFQQYDLRSYLHSSEPLSSTLQRVVLQMTPGQAAILGLIINIAAQLGDLAESMIKRGAGVKDSGTILPGHGGILDRIDALLFAAPVALLLFTLLDRYLPAH